MSHLTLRSFAFVRAPVSTRRKFAQADIRSFLFLLVRSAIISWEEKSPLSSSSTVLELVRLFSSTFFPLFASQAHLPFFPPLSLSRSSSTGPWLEPASTHHHHKQPHHSLSTSKLNGLNLSGMDAGAQWKAKVGRVMEKASEMKPSFNKGSSGGGGGTGGGKSRTRTRSNSKNKSADEGGETSFLSLEGGELPEVGTSKRGLKLNKVSSSLSLCISMPSISSPLSPRSSSRLELTLVSASSFFPSQSSSATPPPQTSTTTPVPPRSFPPLPNLSSEASAAATPVVNAPRPPAEGAGTQLRRSGREDREGGKTEPRLRRRMRWTS